MKAEVYAQINKQSTTIRAYTFRLGIEEKLIRYHQKTCKGNQQFLSQQSRRIANVGRKLSIIAAVFLPRVLNSQGQTKKIWLEILQTISVSEARKKK